MRRVVVSVLCVLLVATALSASDEDFAVRTKEIPKIEVQPDKALVYVVRPAKLGMAIRIWAFSDETALGMTKGKTFSHAYVDPGSHVFWARAENVSAVEHEVEAGKTYYLKQKVKMGGLKARVRVEFLSEEEGLEALKKCGKHSVLTESGLARAAEIAAEKYETAKEKAADE